MLIAAVLTAVLAGLAYAVYTSSGPIVVVGALAVAAVGGGIGALVVRRRPWAVIWLASSVGALIGFVAGTAAALLGLAAVFAGWA